MQEPHRRYNRSVGSQNRWRRALCALFVLVLSAVSPARAQQKNTDAAPPSGAAVASTGGSCSGQRRR
jgi:hypothetical protein